MAETTQLELVTPANIMIQKPVQMVVAPGAEGLFGVLPRHAPLLSDLVRGVVEVHENGSVAGRYMIDGGLADVSGEAVTILTWTMPIATPSRRVPMRQAAARPISSMRCLPRSRPGPETGQKESPANAGLFCARVVGLAVSRRSDRRNCPSGSDRRRA